MNDVGRPLRFLGYCLGGWVGLRALSVLAPAMWSLATTPASPDFVRYRSMSDEGGALASATPATAGASAKPGADIRAIASTPGLAGASLGSSSPAMMGWSDSTADLMLSSTLAFVQPRMSSGLVDRLSLIVAGSEGRAEIAAPAPVAPRANGPGRWSGTAWLLWRPETGGGFVQAPLLGGSQAGARLDYRLTSGKVGQLGLYGRVSRAFTGPSSEEAALGVAWRPGKLPVSLLAERRQRIGPGGRNGFALLAAGGVGPRDIAPRVEAEGYAQAGIVGLPGSDGFADGKASLGYRLTPAAARRSLTLGASLSGSIQPGAGRVDVGPELKLRLPAGSASLRLSTEWRTRIAGDARPASGPAVTLVTDF